MEFTEVLAKIEENPSFQEWKKNNPTFFLAHGFKMDDVKWQVGFSDGEKVVSIVLEPFEIMESAEAVKRDDTTIPELKPENVLPLDKAIETFQKMIKEKYSAETVFKTIIILQNLDGTVYNMTAMTQAMKTLNAKINMNGEVVEDSIADLISN